MSDMEDKIIRAGGLKQGEMVVYSAGTGLPYSHFAFISRLAQEFDPTEEEYLQGLYARLKQADEEARLQQERNNEESFLDRKYSI